MCSKIFPAGKRVPGDKIFNLRRVVTQGAAAYLMCGQPPVQVVQGIIKTGVPTGTTLNNSSTALFCNAMQPRVQSFWQPPPWMNICPPRAVLEGGNLIESFACLI